MAKPSLPAAARPTMMDVAAAAGVSQATVSLVLSGSRWGRLSDTTRQRVIEAAERLNYKFVRRGSRATQPGTASSIFFIADEISTDPWMTLAFEGVRDRALELGYNATMAVSHGDPEIEASLLATAARLPLLGCVYGTILTRQVNLPPAFGQLRTVLVNCYDDEGRHASVLPGDVVGGRTATEHLIKLGRRRIGLINGQQGVDAARDRLKGYKQALASHDVAFDPTLVRPGNWEPSSGYAITLELMALDNPPDAIFCANDMMALGCFDALRHLGLSIPDDVAVIGFDDREVARFMHPPLSTLLLPQYEMGRTAADLLLDAAEDLLTAHPDVKAIYAACGPPAVGATQAIENAGIANDAIIMVGVDACCGELDKIASRQEDATVAQFPAKMGELGADTLVKAIRGEPIESLVDTGAGLVTKENLAQFQ